MTEIRELTEDEIRERKKLLAYQAFYFQVRQLVSNFENCLKEYEAKKEKE